MHAVGSKLVHSSWTLLVLFSVENKTKQNKTLVGSGAWGLLWCGDDSGGLDWA